MWLLAFLEGGTKKLRKILILQVEEIGTFMADLILNSVNFLTLAKNASETPESPRFRSKLLIHIELKI